MVDINVELTDYMGSDLSVVNAARVSFSKTSAWEGTDRERRLSARDQRLIKYLATNDHFTPFTHVQITMRETVPIFVARQRFKHQIGFSYNEVSRRYVDDSPEFYTPETWRGRADDKKQGSSSDVITKVELDEHIVWDDPMSPRLSISIDQLYEGLLEHSEMVYHGMIQSGVAPEQARMVLPQSMITEYVVTGSLAAWARAYLLRSQSDAQKEVQDLADQWNELISQLDDLKYSWSALIGKEI